MHRGDPACPADGRQPGDRGAGADCRTSLNASRRSTDRLRRRRPPALRPDRTPGPPLQPGRPPVPNDEVGAAQEGGEDEHQVGPRSAGAARTIRSPGTRPAGRGSAPCRILMFAQWQKKPTTTMVRISVDPPLPRTDETGPEADPRRTARPSTTQILKKKTKSRSSRSPRSPALRWSRLTTPFRSITSGLGTGCGRRPGVTTSIPSGDVLMTSRSSPGRLGQSRAISSRGSTGRSCPPR